MATLTNKGRCAQILPARTRGDVGCSATVAADASIEVPDWYVDELRAEEGTAALLAAGILQVTTTTAPAPLAPASLEGESESDGGDESKKKRTR